jgi:hypothetical protein
MQDKKEEQDVSTMFEQFLKKYRAQPGAAINRHNAASDLSVSSICVGVKTMIVEEPQEMVSSFKTSR